MEEATIKLQNKNYGLHIALFIVLMLGLQLFFGFYTYCVIRPEIIRSVNKNLEKFNQNILKMIERNEITTIYEDYNLIYRNKRELEGSGNNYDDTDEDSSEVEDDYKLKNIEEFCKQVNENCVKVGLPGVPGLPGIKGVKGDKGYPGVDGLSIQSSTETTPISTTVTSKPVSVYPSTEPTTVAENNTENATNDIPTTKPSKSTTTTNTVSLFVLSLIVIFINYT